MKYRPNTDAIIFDLNGTLWNAYRSTLDLPAEQNTIITQGDSFDKELQNGIRELARHYKLFIVSNCQKCYLEEFLKLSDLKASFIEALCKGHNQLSKKENIALIIARHKLKKPVYVGDTHWDMEAAFDAGAKFIFASYGFGQITVSCPRVSSFTDLVNTFSLPQCDQIFDIKKLKEHDLINAQAFYQSIGYHQEITMDNLLYGAFHEGTLVGLVRLTLENGVWVLRGMQIDPSFQFLGLGTKLINLLKNDLVSDCYCIPHRWLKRFYEQIGFVEIIINETTPAFLAKRLRENKSKYPHLILMKRPRQ